MPAQKATLTKDGTRKAVEIGSPEEKDLFSQGFTLEKEAPATPAGSLEGTLDSGQAPTNNFDNMRTVAENLTREAMNRGPSARDILNKFKQDVGGVEGIGDPSLSGKLIDIGAREKVSNVSDIFRQTMRTINTMEQTKKQQEQFSNDLMLNLAQGGILGKISGEDLDVLRNTGSIPPTMLETINQAVLEQQQQPAGQSDFQFKETEGGVSGAFDPSTGTFKPFEEGRVQPSGQIISGEINGRAFNLDSVATPSLGNIDTQLKQAGFGANDQQGLILGAVESSTYRSAEQQKALFDAGASRLDGSPGHESKHQTGMAIDVFPDQAYVDSITPTMNQNGWYQTAGDIGDNVHFEFFGTGGQGGAGGVAVSEDEDGKPIDAQGKYADEIEFGFNEKIDVNKLPDLGGKQITNKTSRQANLPFGVTDKQADWIIEHRAGNVQFQQLNSKEVEKIADLLELREDVQEIRTLKEDVNTGFISGRAKTAQTKIFETEATGVFNELKIKTGKNLAAFIKSISGAAVSEEEAQRLTELIPNVNMSDNEFVIALDDFEDTLNTTIDAKVNQYDLGDEDSLRRSILGGEVVAQDEQVDNFLNSF